VVAGGEVAVKAGERAMEVGAKPLHYRDDAGSEGRDARKLMMPLHAFAHRLHSAACEAPADTGEPGTEGAGPTSGRLRRAPTAYPQVEKAESSAWTKAGSEPP